MLDGVAKSEDTALRLCFITNVRILLTHTNHNTGRRLASGVKSCKEMDGPTHDVEDGQRWKLKGGVTESARVQPLTDTSTQRQRGSASQGEIHTEDSPWSIIAGEASLAHSGAVSMISALILQRSHFSGHGQELTKARVRDKGGCSLEAYPLSMTRAATSSVGFKTEVSDPSNGRSMMITLRK